MAGPTADFWQQCFGNKETGWDRGAPSPQLLAWLDSGALEPCLIAVPGCGSGWEVAELARRGFDVVGIDYTTSAPTSSDFDWYFVKPKKTQMPKTRIKHAK